MVILSQNVVVHFFFRNNILNILMLQKQVQTLPLDISNNSKMEDNIILLIISIHSIRFSQIFLQTTPKWPIIKN